MTPRPIPRHLVAVVFIIVVLLSLTCAALAAGPQYNPLYAFNTRSVGNYPTGVVGDANGNLYGVTFEGGTANLGTIYELSPPAQQGQSWTESVLYNFTGGQDGGNPYVELTLDKSGNLYGSSQGGVNSHTATIFELSPNGGSWTFTPIYSFPASYGTPFTIGSSLIFDQSGNLYGEVAAPSSSALGFVYELSPPAQAGGAWTEATLYTFQGANVGEDGTWPSGGLSFDAQGNLYGTTEEGGVPGRKQCNSAGCGIVFELSPPAQPGGAWTETILYRFLAQTDGGNPEGGVAFDKSGNLFGTAFDGGDGVFTAGSGVVFELTPGNGTWIETVIYTFDAAKGAGLKGPSAGVILDPSGRVYGTTFSSRNLNCTLLPCGGVFALVPPKQAGGEWTEFNLHVFSGPPDGDEPNGRLYLGKNALYGVTEYGGDENTKQCKDAGGCGLIFQITR